MLKRLRKKVAGFRKAERGVAAVEFALLLPVMLAVYIGTMEASMLITMDRKIQSVAGAVGDLVARSDKSIATTQMRDYFRAASGIMTPYSSDAVLQVITAVHVDQNNNATIAWSRQFNGDGYSTTTPRVPGQSFPLPPEMIAISTGQTVIAAEASYSYTPLFGLFFNQSVNLYRSSFFLPRFGGDIVID